MRNLEILLHASTSLIDSDSETGVEVACFAVDEYNHRLFVLSTNNTLYCFGYSQLLPANTCKLKYQSQIGVDQSTTAVSIAYIQELNALVIAYSNGSIFTLSNQNESEGKSIVVF